MMWSLTIVSLVHSVASGVVPRTLYEPEAGSDELAKRTQKAFEVNQSLPNVLILGDSISIGYTALVRKTLQGKANVFRPMTADGRTPENSEGTTNVLKRIDAWLKIGRGGGGRHHNKSSTNNDGDDSDINKWWDVIHFNFGLHDLKHVDPVTGVNSPRASDPVQADIVQYSSNLEHIVGKLERTGAALIFATTTPVPPGAANPLREREAPALYNKAALEVVTTRARGNGVIRVNDLYAAVEGDLQTFQQPGNVHFKPAGNQFMAKQVAESIEAALAERKPKQQQQQKAE